MWTCVRQSRRLCHAQKIPDPPSIVTQRTSLPSEHIHSYDQPAAYVMCTQNPICRMMEMPVSLPRLWLQLSPESYSLAGIQASTISKTSDWLIHSQLACNSGADHQTVLSQGLQADPTAFPCCHRHLAETQIPLYPLAMELLHPCLQPPILG